MRINLLLLKAVSFLPYPTRPRIAAVGYLAIAVLGVPRARGDDVIVEITST